MSGRIHFGSGKTLEITEAEFQNMSPKLNMKGVKTQKTRSGHLIPLNSNTIEYIEWVPEKEDSKINPEPVLRTKPVVQEEEKVPEAVVKAEEPKPVEEKKTQAQLLEEMVEKSNCKHEPEKLVLYRQHTAKGIRYFPLCTYCGKRERYVSESKIVNGEYAGTPNEKWTEQDVAEAAVWIED